jgi:asparagine synthase (glutamine-hydrolysing)
MWRGVKKMSPGTWMEWRVGDEAGPRVRRWWSAPESVDGGEREGEFEGVLGEVAREHLIGDVPVGMFLSAGLDSSSIAVSLKRGGARMDAVRAFTLATRDVSDEDVIARDLAARVGMPWSRVGFGSGESMAAMRETAGAFDEPQGYTALLTATRIARVMREQASGIKVVIGGDGGDEALGGYAWHRDAVTHPLSLAGFVSPTAEDVREHARLVDVVARIDASDAERGGALHALGRMSYVHRYLVRTFGGFHPAEAAALCGTSAAEAMDGFASWLEPEDRSGMPSIRRAQRLDVMGFCAGSILPKLDRACMSVGLELRSPFLDRRVLEMGMRRGVEDGEMDGRGSKPGLRRMLSRGVEEGLVPREVLERGKQGFSLRMPGEDFESLAAMIDSSRLVGAGIVRRDWARFVPRAAEARRVRLFTLGMLAAWYETRGA